MSPWTAPVALLATVGTAAVAGVFFTFSTFTMDGLRRLPPADGAAAMQAINREAPKPALMLLLFGTAVLCLVLVVWALLNLAEPRAKYYLAAGVLYLVGAVVLTGVYHVPRNDLLAAVDPASPEGIAYWSTYLAQWVRMNHVRALAPLAAAILLAVSSSLP